MASEFVVRRALPADNLALSALLEASYPTLMAGAYDEAELAAALPFMTRANPALLSSGTFYLAEAEDRAMVGCGGWTRERPGSGEIVGAIAHVRHFATHPQWIGRGSARAIYAACEEQARAAGVQRFECYSSLNAEGFYVAVGFVRVRRIEVPMTPDLTLPSILMAKSI